MPKLRDNPEKKRKKKSSGGALPDSHDPRDKRTGCFTDVLSIVGIRVKPKAISWKEYMSDVRDQGPDGACTAFASLSALEAMWRKKYGDSVDLSEEMSYLYARMYDEWPGTDYEGSSVRGCLKGIYKHGSCPEEVWPYDPKKETQPKLLNFLESAAAYRIKRYQSVTAKSVLFSAGVNGDAIARALTKSPVVVAMSLPKTFDDTGKNGVVKDGKPDENAGHAMCIVGYDPATDSFEIRNSWGKWWANEGYCYMSRELVEKCAYSAWIIRL